MTAARVAEHVGERKNIVAFAANAVGFDGVGPLPLREDTTANLADILPGDLRSSAAGDEDFAFELQQFLV